MSVSNTIGSGTNFFFQKFARVLIFKIILRSLRLRVKVRAGIGRNFIIKFSFSFFNNMLEVLVGVEVFFDLNKGLIGAKLLKTSVSKPFYIYSRVCLVRQF